MQILNKINYLIKTGTYRISVVARVLTKKYIKNNFFILPFFVIPLHHGELVQIGQQGKIAFAHFQTPFYCCLQYISFLVIPFYYST